MGGFIGRATATLTTQWQEASRLRMMEFKITAEQDALKD
jgi:hypothetical protein